jgi:hypothetical protein
MNSRRLHGVQRLTGWLFVQVDPPEYRQGVAELDAEQDPVLQRRTQRVFTLPQGRPEGDDTFTGARWDGTGASPARGPRPGVSTSVDRGARRRETGSRQPSDVRCRLKWAVSGEEGRLSER